MTGAPNACTSCASRPRSTSGCATSCAMGKVTGFLDYPRQGPSYRPVPVRLRDWREVYEPQSDDEVSVQGARCMDCGIPFCMQGCPLGNRIPTFNDHVYRSHWEAGRRPAVRHQQLSRSSRVGSVRHRVSRPACSASRTVRSRSNESSTRSPNTPSRTASTSRHVTRRPNRPSRRRRRLRSGRPRRGGPAGERRSRGARLRTQRRHRRSPALRHS